MQDRKVIGKMDVFMESFLLDVIYSPSMRFDVLHRVVSLARQNKHFDNEVPDRARVLDLGTGTGIWAIDVSEPAWGSTLASEFAIVKNLTVQRNRGL
ncbi:Secondary metabolism regulator laeA like protein [Verticillium longisporum]|uniref:Secondary metabolism regulator laeA like protein n=1 Tax=Verticillium longisporum TaxID=100787 RepID=A0A8I3A1J9_VERLO|nr:Secondary metabolism regulator laeA like protein [Verticillium longisporum]